MDNNRSITGSVALRFFGGCVFLLGIIGFCSSLLFWFFPPADQSRLVIPWIFLTTTFLLGSVSLFLHRAVQAVRRERQQDLRLNLCRALAAAVLFVGIQSHGLRCLVEYQHPPQAQTSAETFVFVFAALHGLHVVVALLFLLFVTVRATQGRYDHEYYWGPFFTGWFWHVLGIVWLGILFVLSLAFLTG